MKYGILALVLIALVSQAQAQETPQPQPVTGCQVLVNHLKQQRDTLEAQIANLVAEVEKLKAAKPKEGK